MLEYGTELKRIAYLYVNDQDECEDIIQEVFISCYQNLDTFRHQAHYKTWLIRITINKCKDYRKRWSIKNLIYKRDIHPQNTNQSIESMYMQKETTNQIVELIASLSGKYKEVLILYYYQDMTMQEISDILKISINTVKSRLLRGKKRLKLNLKGVVDFNNLDKDISDQVKNYLDKNIKFSTLESEKIHLKIQQGSNKSRKFNSIYWTFLASAAVIFFVLSLSFVKDQIVGTETDQALQGSENGEIILSGGKELVIDMSDIEQMNIGAEMPRLLYANERIVVMQGTFGLLVYNMQDSVISNRISYEHTKPYGVSLMLASVSEDGTTIYIGNDDMENEFLYTLQYDIRTKIIKKNTQQPSHLYQTITIETPGYNEQYDKYFDLLYLTGDKIVELDKSFICLRSSDWSMKNVQIVICSYEDGESNVYDVFK